jgi:hypothetical protein
MNVGPRRKCLVPLSQGTTVAQLLQRIYPPVIDWKSGRKVKNFCQCTDLLIPPYNFHVNSRITSKALRVSLLPCQNFTETEFAAPVALFYVLDADPWTQLTGFPPSPHQNY